MTECDEYCEGDGTLIVDDSTWLSSEIQPKDAIRDKLDGSSNGIEKKRKALEREKCNDKRTKNSNAQQRSTTRTKKSVNHSQREPDLDVENSVQGEVSISTIDSNNHPTSSNSTTSNSIQERPTSFLNSNVNRILPTNQQPVDVIL